eukprot:scaffold46102_cov55-Attheya_sp.AAC.2
MMSTEESVDGFVDVKQVDLEEEPIDEPAPVPEPVEEPAAPEPLEEPEAPKVEEPKATLKPAAVPTITNEDEETKEEEGEKVDMMEVSKEKIAEIVASVTETTAKSLEVSKEKIGVIVAQVSEALSKSVSISKEKFAEIVEGVPKSLESSKEKVAEIVAKVIAAYSKSLDAAKKSCTEIMPEQEEPEASDAPVELGGDSPKSFPQAMMEGYSKIFVAATGSCREGVDNIKVKADEQGAQLARNVKKEKEPPKAMTTEQFMETSKYISYSKKIESELSFAPFHDDGYVYPTMGDEVVSMLLASLLVYPMGQLQMLCKFEKKQETITPAMEGFTDLPFDIKAAIELLLDPEIMKKKTDFNFPEEDLVMTSTAIDFIKESVDVAKMESYTMTLADGENKPMGYAVLTNHDAKRIEVVFKGNFTDATVKTDVTGECKECPNPIEIPSEVMPPEWAVTPDSEESHVSFHKGLHDYLFSGAGSKLGETSKYQLILDKVAQAAILNPGYKLYVTGYSKGGAIANMFAFMVAAEPPAGVSLPVTTVSFGAPRVGDQTFRVAFQTLEQLGRIRAMRVVHRHDAVPRISAITDKSYKHVGVQLTTNLPVSEFHPGDITLPPVEIDFPEFNSTPGSEFVRGLKNSSMINKGGDLAHHSASLYAKGSSANEGILSKLYLNDIYGNDDIVGPNKLGKDESIRLLKLEVAALKIKALA